MVALPSANLTHTPHRGYISTAEYYAVPTESGHIRRLLPFLRDDFFQAFAKLVKDLDGITEAYSVFHQNDQQRLCGFVWKRGKQVHMAFQRPSWTVSEVLQQLIHPDEFVYVPVEQRGAVRFLERIGLRQTGSVTHDGTMWVKMVR